MTTSGLAHPECKPSPLDPCVRWGLLLVLSGWLIAMPTAVSAEGYLALYGGVAGTAGEDVTVEVNTVCVVIIVPACTKETASQEVQFDHSVTLGGRLGYWADSHRWIGGALDVSYFEADGDRVEIFVVPVSLLLMVRVPLLVSEEFPKGRLQPYGGGGPSLVFADSKVDFTPAVSSNVDDFGLGVGWDVRGGLAWQFHPRVALFGEYRFTHLKLLGEELLPQSGSGTVETTLKTEHFLVGLSLRF